MDHVVQGWGYFLVVASVVAAWQHWGSLSRLGEALLVGAIVAIQFGFPCQVDRHNFGERQAGQGLQVAEVRPSVEQDCSICLVC